MEHLEEQVSDLRSFLGGQPVAALSPLGTGGGQQHHLSDATVTGYSPQPHHHHSPSFSEPLSAPGNNSTQTPSSYHGSAKRKADEDESQAKQQRSKRNRYISLACNECKRRKIKCNGQTPCQRCGNLNLQCLYAPNCCSNNFKESPEYRDMTDHLGQLQEQVNSLLSDMEALKQETLRLAPIQDRILPPPTPSARPSPSRSSMPVLPRPSFATSSRFPSSFSGPTSIAFTVDVAKNTLQNMGYSAPADASEENSAVPEEMVPAGDSASRSPSRRPRDPLWEYDKEEMVRLCRLYEEEVGIMYPVLKVEMVIQHAKNLAKWLQAADRNGFAPPFGLEGGISDLKTLQLKIIMCCALVVEEHGNSAKADRLYDSMETVVHKKLMSEPATVANLPLLAIVAGYHFLANDEVIAWRIMGYVVRLCFELGLHRREGLAKIADPMDRRNALNTFWSAYVLDRRWAFGTGLPYVCADDKIDPKLPYPDEHPYLVAMITYSKLGARIWRLVDYFEPAVIRELKRSDFEELDREILDWYDSVPEEVKVGSLDREMIPMPNGPAYDLQRLQIWTRLRLNQIRIWLFAPVLHSAISIVDNMPLARTAVDLAKDTIQYLARLNSTTNLYRRLQVFYHQFLTSAIAVLFLASTHAPLQFSAHCRAEFYMALELVKDMSARSWVSKRLWRTIRSLKALAPRLGLEEEDPHSSAAVAMTTLAAGGAQTPGGMGAGSSSSSHSPRSAAAAFGRTASLGPPIGGPSSTPASTPTHQAPGNGNQTVDQVPPADDQHNGLRIQTEMSRIFEGYMGMTGGGSMPTSRIQSPDVPPHFRPGLGLMAPSEEGAGTSEYALNGSVYHHMKEMF